MEGNKENCGVIGALQLFITKGFCALETLYRRLLLLSGVMLFTHHCAQKHGLTYGITNPKYQAAICNKILMYFLSLSKRNLPYEYSLSSESVMGVRKIAKKEYTPGYVFYYIPETNLMSSLPKFLISLPCTWLLPGGLCGF